MRPCALDTMALARSTRAKRIFPRPSSYGGASRAVLKSAPENEASIADVGFRLGDASFLVESQGCSLTTTTVFASSTIGTWARRRQTAHRKGAAQPLAVAAVAAVVGSSLSLSGNAKQAWKRRE
jgi:hypothetical protein